MNDIFGQFLENLQPREELPARADKRRRAEDAWLGGGGDDDDGAPAGGAGVPQGGKNARAPLAAPEPGTRAVPPAPVAPGSAADAPGPRPQMAYAQFLRSRPENFRDALVLAEIVGKPVGMR